VNVFQAEINVEVLSENLTEPSEIAKFLAIAKAKHAFEKYCGLNNAIPDLLIASDTVVDLDGYPIGKPKNKEGAIEALTRLVTILVFFFIKIQCLLICK
jgi:predicted house-cleaning NTP pyrophosphatase (Maf/HAM1 superfamily)